MWPFSKAETRADPAENPKIPLSDPAVWRSLLGEWHAAAGVTVTQKTALKVPAIWAAVNFLAGTVASLPLQVFLRGEDGSTPAKSDPLYAILHDAPNDEWTSYAWRHYGMTNVLLRGRWLDFIERNKAKRVMNLWPLDPEKMTIERRNGRKVYHYKDGDRNITYGADEIIDVPFMLEADGVTHVNPVERLKGSIGLSLALEQYAEKFFLNGGVPPLALSGPMPSPAAAARAKTDIKRAIQDANSDRSEVLVVPGGHDLKAIGIDPDKSQMEAARRFQVEEVARMYGLPPVFLQDLTRATFSNNEQQDLHLAKHTITKWVEQIEQELNLKLFSARNTTRFVEFNLNALMRGDYKTRMEGNARAIQTGQLTPNEARAMENRPAKPNGDDLLVQGATVPLGSQPIAAAAPANDNADEKDDAA